MSSGAGQGEGNEAEVKPVVKREEQVVKQEGAVGDTHADADVPTGAEPVVKNYAEVKNEDNPLIKKVGADEVDKNEDTDEDIYQFTDEDTDENEDGNEDENKDVETDAIWRAFLKGDEPEQRYWVAEWEENHKICHRFEQLMECLRKNVQYIKFTIYSTLSPLANESTSYKKFRDTHSGVNLIIKIASMTAENNAEDPQLGLLGKIRNVAVEHFQGLEDWKNLSSHLHQNYARYDKERKEKDRQTGIALQEAIDTEERSEVLLNFRYSGAHIDFKTNEKYWAVKMPENYCKVYKSRKLGCPPLRRGLQRLLSDLGGRLSTPQKQNEVITLYCSLSPVKHECKKIQKFLRELVEKGKVVSLEIKIAGLYRVPRQSCKERSCPEERHKAPNAEADEYYAENARALMNIHPRVTAFSEHKEWQTLVDVINKSHNCHGEAEFTKESYDINYHGEASSPTPKDEDLRTKKDLEGLRKKFPKINIGKVVRSK